MKLEAHNHVAYRSRWVPRSFALQVCVFCSLNFSSRLTRHSHLPCLEHRIFLRGHCPAVRPQLVESPTGHVAIRLAKLCRKEPHVEFTHLLRSPKFLPLQDLFFVTQSNSQKLHFQIFIVYEGSSMCPSSKIILFGAFWWSLEVLSGLARGQIVSSPEHQCSC